MQKFIVNLLCLLVSVGYSSETVVTDMKLRHLSSQFLTLCYSSGVAILAAILFFCTKQKKEMLPSTPIEWGFISIMVIFSLIAALSHFAALHMDAGAMKLSMSYAMMPVVTTIIMAIFKQELPERRVVIAWVLLVIAVYLVSTSKGASNV